MLIAEIQGGLLDVLRARFHEVSLHSLIRQALGLVSFWGHNQLRLRVLDIFPMYRLLMLCRHHFCAELFKVGSRLINSNIEFNILRAWRCRTNGFCSFFRHMPSSHLLVLKNMSLSFFCDVSLLNSIT